jgi:hypothetical protein
MEDLKRQLVELRWPIARIDRNYAGGSPRPGGRMPLRSPSWKNRHRRLFLLIVTGFSARSGTVWGRMLDFPEIPSRPSH